QRRDHEDVAAPATEVGHGGAGQPEDRGEVGAEDLVPRLVARLRYGRVATHAGVVDQDLQAAVGLDGAGHRGLADPALPQVARVVDGVAARGLDLADERLEL